VSPATESRAAYKSRIFDRIKALLMRLNLWSIRIVLRWKAASPINILALIDVEARN
jgi:hypothetical protein